VGVGVTRVSVRLQWTQVEYACVHAMMGMAWRSSQLEGMVAAGPNAQLLEDEDGDGGEHGVPMCITPQHYRGSAES
jgi:hypothetical protein